MLLSLKERRVWIEVGYSLEQWITDGFAGETSRDYMIPEFREGRYGAGLVAGTARVIGRIADGRGITLADLERPRERQREAAPQITFSTIVILFIIILVISRISRGGPRGGMRRWGGGGWSGWSSGVGPFGGGGWSRGGGGFGGGGFGGRLRAASAAGGRRSGGNGSGENGSNTEGRFSSDSDWKLEVGSWKLELKLELKLEIPGSSSSSKRLK